MSANRPIGPRTHRIARITGGVALAAVVPLAGAATAHAATLSDGSGAAASSVRTQADAAQQRSLDAKVEAAQSKSRAEARTEAAHVKHAAEAEKQAAEKQAAAKRAAAKQAAEKKAEAKKAEAKKASDNRAKGSAASRGSDRSSLGAGSANAAKWERIAQCESSGDWSANTGNGYYGGLQFDVQSWKAAGGDKYAPRADMASKNEQMAVADKLAAMQGMSSWGCA
ncbi:transglycosylase family protein [Streptomyces sp. ODS28]|uniref:transglycosylase family protein n=1 Tax=Streptomyces sp. ODS28 TaxID=3136688 RepID=UPI0031E9737E